MIKGLSRVLLIVTAGLSLAYLSGCQTDGLGKAPVRKITVDDYADKMKAGWIGQMAGVGWGGPTEFHFKGEIIPEDKMPSWKPTADRCRS